MELPATLVIHTHLLIDGLGEPAIPDALLTVAGEKIVYAGPAARAPEFPGARVIELPGATMLPGLIDAHVHPTYYWEEPDAGTYTYEDEHKIVYSTAMITLLAAGNLHQALLAGTTTVRDMGAVQGVMYEVKHAIARGLIPGPRVYFAGRLIVPTGGHVHYLPGLANEASGPYDLRRAVREEVRGGADFIKLANNGADMTQEELNAAVDEAHRLGKKAACHTSDPPSQSMAIEAGADTFEHGTPSPREIDMALERRIAWSPTLNISEEWATWIERRRRHPDPLIARQSEVEYAEAQEHLEKKHASMEYARQCGLRLLAGTDSYMGEVRFAAMADEIRRLVDYGCTPMQALLAATAWPAQVMGWPDIGTLETGKVADILAVEGNPLENIRALDKVKMVVQGGKVVRISESTSQRISESANQ